MKNLSAKLTLRARMSVLPLLAAAGASLSANAQESAAVLPKNIFRVRAVSVIGFGVGHSFNSNGDRTELLSALNSSIDAKTQVMGAAATGSADGQKLQELYTKLNAVEAGLGDKLFQTNLVSEGSLNFKRFIGAMEYGISDRFTLGLVVPVTQIKITPKSQFVVNSQADQVAAKLDKMGPTMTPLADGVRQFEASREQAFNQQVYTNTVFTNNGYVAPTTTESTGLGDIELGGKWAVHKGDITGLALVSGFRLPTATHRADPHNLLDRSSGDGQLDYSAQVVGTVSPLRNLRFGASLKYTWQFADTNRQPLAAAGQTGLVNLNVEDNWDSVKRNLGDVLDTELNAVLNFFDNSAFTYGAYAYSNKGTDKYSGTKNLDFAGLGANSSSYAHRYEFGVGYSTVPMFRAKKFPVPVEVKISFNDTLKGTNTIDAAYTRFDLYMYF